MAQVGLAWSRLVLAKPGVVSGLRIFDKQRTRRGLDGSAPRSDTGRRGARDQRACRVKHTRPFVGRLTRHAQHAHAGVVIVQNLSLRCLPDQFFKRRLDDLRRFSDDLPLRCRRQRNPQAGIVKLTLVTRQLTRFPG
jgi:hypothetical protein